jgi:hypothetical protein
MPPDEAGKHLLNLARPPRCQQTQDLCFLAKDESATAMPGAETIWANLTKVM